MFNPGLCRRRTRNRIKIKIQIHTVNMNQLFKIVCSPLQAGKLIEAGISPRPILWQILQGNNGEGVNWKVLELLKPVLSAEQVPAWTKHEIDVMIGPRFAKPDLWPDDKIRDNSPTDPNRYPVFFPDKCFEFDNGAQASAAGLLYLLENEFLDAEQCNMRYRAVFMHK